MKTYRAQPDAIRHHTLQVTDGALHIVLKRVDRIHAEAAFPAILLFP